MRLVAVGVLMGLIWFCGGVVGASTQIDEDIEAGSGAGGTEVVTVVDVGETGGGYSGSDGVMDCRWMAIGDRAGNTHESYTVADLGAMVLGETYLFQCFLLATGEEVVHEFRNWDPAAPAPVIDLTTVAYNWAVRSLDRQPLPPPPIVTAPPAGVPTLVNVANFYWTTLPGQHMAESVTDPNNRSTVTATPAKLSIDPGDGSGVLECPASPVPWTESVDEQTPGTCSHEYRLPGTYTTTATLEWDTTYVTVIGGVTYTGTLGRRTTQGTTVLEAQEALTHIRRS